MQQLLHLVGLISLLYCCVTFHNTSSSYVMSDTFHRVALSK